MKVKAIAAYNDTLLNRRVKKGEEFDVTPDRARVLCGASVCIVLERARSRKRRENKEA